MAKGQRTFVCQSCGHRHNKWVGKCEGCGEWNSLMEELETASTPASQKISLGQAQTYTRLNDSQPTLHRLHSQVEEFDRVCGSGLVPGSVILLGGDPGIGKSTLLLQAMAKLSSQHKVLYVSGEESIDQIQRRAHRLGLADAPVNLMAETNISHILATLSKDKKIEVVVIDSIQTLFSDSIESSAGTVSQVRLCAHHLITYAKASGLVVILVGHVTKEGTIAGPKVLEHMVDTVLYFEGERGHHFRILRAVKNRYGACNEIGVFDMGPLGLEEVSNPSALFLAGRSDQTDGSTVFAGLEGSRPLLVEIQALVSHCPYGNPRRSVIGWDLGRLNMILAVLETRCGISFANKDVYLNIAGGLKITEPGVDLAAAASLLSALSGISAPKDAVFCGEIGLSGEIRPTQGLDVRLKEADKLGFKRAYVPESPRQQLPLFPSGLTVYDKHHVRELLDLFVPNHAQQATE